MQVAAIVPDPRIVRPAQDRVAAADAMAELVAEGSSVNAAGQQLGLTRGQAVATWRRICRELGAQAA